jgi:hypothetical protein
MIATSTIVGSAETYLLITRLTGWTWTATRTGSLPPTPASR